MLKIKVFEKPDTIGLTWAILISFVLGVILVFRLYVETSVAPGQVNQVVSLMVGILFLASLVILWLTFTIRSCKKVLSEYSFLLDTMVRHEAISEEIPELLKKKRHHRNGAVDEECLLRKQGKPNDARLRTARRKATEAEAEYTRLVHVVTKLGIKDL